MAIGLSVKTETEKWRPPPRLISEEIMLVGPATNKASSTKQPHTTLLQRPPPHSFDIQPSYLPTRYLLNRFTLLFNSDCSPQQLLAHYG